MFDPKKNNRVNKERVINFLKGLTPKTLQEERDIIALLLSFNYNISIEKLVTIRVRDFQGEKILYNNHWLWIQADEQKLIESYMDKKQVIDENTPLLGESKTIFIETTLLDKIMEIYFINNDKAEPE